MESLSQESGRSNGGTNQVGSFFIISSRFPDLSYLVAMVDLPTPSDGFTYAFSSALSNGMLTYTYTSDPNAGTDLQTFVLPLYPITQDSINKNLITNISVKDSTSKQAPKTGQVSSIQFQGKWEKPKNVKVAATPDDGNNRPSNWYVNSFIIQSATQNQYFLVATMDIYPELDGYDGPYTNILSDGGGVGGGDVQVSVNKPVAPATAPANNCAYYVCDLPAPTETNPTFTLSMYTVWGTGPVSSSSDTSSNYDPQPNTGNPDAII